MALELEQMLAESLRDLLEGGWAKYLELEDGRVRTSWHQEGDMRWLEIWDHSGTELVGRFTVTVGVHPFELPPIGPEDDGALRAELSERPEPDHQFEGGYSGMSCVTMVELADGTGDSCGLPPERHPKPVPAWDPDNPGCAPEECGGSRLDPCNTVMRTKGAAHDGDSGVLRTWAQACAGDAAQGGDGQFYPVVRAAAGTGPNVGFTVVTLLIGGEEKVYNMHPIGVVQLIRGEVGRQADLLAAVGMGPEVLRSGTLR